MSDLRTAGLIESQRGKAEPKLLKTRRDHFARHLFKC